MNVEERSGNATFLMLYLDHLESSAMRLLNLWLPLG